MIVLEPPFMPNKVIIEYIQASFRGGHDMYMASVLENVLRDLKRPMNWVDPVAIK